jgi:4-diphosphocytidyl-2-C-methyl-D-erythritol kinase
MILFPNAKINIGLRVIERRNDGFHNIETLFVPVDLCDVLEFNISQRPGNTIKISGRVPENNPENNLVIDAWKLMHEKYNIPHLNIHLHKAIPIGAGLGGGSSDAAFMLKGINALFNCGCSNEELKELAAGIGSDCPFFIENVSAIGTGRGEKLQTIDLSLNQYKLLLVNPEIHISSKEAYEGVTPGKQIQTLKDLVKKPVTDWKNCVFNDFENSIFQKYPRIQEIKSAMYESGAVYSSMTGSGSTVFGLYSGTKKEVLEQLFSEDFISIIDIL